MRRQNIFTSRAFLHVLLIWHIVFALGCVMGQSEAKSRSLGTSPQHPVLNGVWEGEYQCQRRRIGATLTFGDFDEGKGSATIVTHNVDGGPALESREHRYQVVAGSGDLTFSMTLASKRGSKKDRINTLYGNLNRTKRQISGTVHPFGCGALKLARSAKQPVLPAKPDLTQTSRSSDGHGEEGTVNSLDSPIGTLTGHWFGVYRCRGRVEDISIEIKSAGVSYEGMVEAGGYLGKTTASFSEPVNGNIDVNPERFLGKKATLSKLFGNVDLMRIKMPDRKCNDVLVIREQPNSGMSPSYCKKIVEWSKIGREIGEVAKWFSPKNVIPQYDRLKVSLIGLFSKSLFAEHFGEDVRELSNESFDKFEREMLSCGLLTEEIGPIPNSIIEFYSFRDAQVRFLQKGTIRHSDFEFTQQYKTFKENRGSFPEFTTGPSVLEGWQELLEHDKPLVALDEFVRQREDAIRKVDPRIEAPVYAELRSSYNEIKENPDWQPPSVTAARDKKFNAYVNAAKNGDEEAIQFLSAALKVVSEKKYALVTKDAPLVQFTRIMKLKKRLDIAIGESSEAAALGLMTHFMERYKQTEFNGFAIDAIQLAKPAGFSKEKGEPNNETEIGQFGQLALAKAMYLNSSNTRGFTYVLNKISPLLDARYESVRAEATRLYAQAENAKDHAPPLRDSAAGFGLALGCAVMNSWTTPTEPNTQLPSDIMATEIAVDLWLK